jgi:hypothetical protein
MDTVADVQLVVPLIDYRVSVDPKKIHDKDAILPWWMPRPGKTYSLALPSALHVAMRSRSMYQTTFSIDPPENIPEILHTSVAVVYRPPILKITETAKAGSWTMISVYEAKV